MCVWEVETHHLVAKSLRFLSEFLSCFFPLEHFEQRSQKLKAVNGDELIRFLFQLHSLICRTYPHRIRKFRSGLHSWSSGKVLTRNLLWCQEGITRTLPLPIVITTAHDLQYTHSNNNNNNKSYLTLKATRHFLVFLTQQNFHFRLTLHTIHHLNIYNLLCTVFSHFPFQPSL